MTGLRRHAETRVSALLGQFPAVVVLGARQVGKTTLVQRCRPDWPCFDLQNPVHRDRIERDPGFFFEQHPSGLILDEAQDWPELFRVLRGIIDQRRHEKGRFLLTGSSSPELLGHVSETLAGRVALVRLDTLKLTELCEKPLSPFYGLFAGPLTRDAIERLVPVGEPAAPLPSAQVERAWLRGGYPEPSTSPDPEFWAEWMAQYQDTYVHRDVARLFPRLNYLVYRRFIDMLAGLSGTILNRRDVARSLDVSEGSVRQYLQIAEGTFLWRSLPSFERNVQKRVVKMPKGFLRDSGLRHFLLRIVDQEGLQAHPQVGSSFESFAIEEILRGLEVAGVKNTQAHYYRTRNGAEIDLILDGSFGTLPVEIKHGTSVSSAALRSLETFLDEHQLPLALLVNRSERAEWLTRRTLQLPVGWL